MKQFILITVLVMCFGCAIKKDWVATGGSRSDGTVKLSFEYKQFQQPVLDENQGQDVAGRRCRAWGYSRAEAFGGVISQCQFVGAYGCSRWFVTKEYQCID